MMDHDGTYVIPIAKPVPSPQGFELQDPLNQKHIKLNTCPATLYE
jgi:hypothetical protein